MGNKALIVIAILAAAGLAVWYLLSQQPNAQAPQATSQAGSAQPASAGSTTVTPAGAAAFATFVPATVAAQGFTGFKNLTAFAVTT